MAIDLIIEWKDRHLVELVYSLEKEIVVSIGSSSLKYAPELYERMKAAGLNPQDRSQWEFAIAQISERSRRIEEDELRHESYYGLDWEPRSPKVKVDRYRTNEKRLYSNAKSMERIGKFGREYRHPQPYEVFGLIMAGMENELNLPYLINAYHDAINSHGEWLYPFFKRKDDMLYVFHPEGTSLPPNCLGLPYAQFDINGLPSKRNIDLKDMPKDFVVENYGREFDYLPQVMRKGIKRAQVSLPEDGVRLPISRGGFNNVFGISCKAMADMRASRWVKEKEQWNSPSLSL